jgi:hypothetical protein
LKSFPTEVGGFKPDFWKVKLGAQAGARLAAGGEDVTGLVSFISRSADLK